jgi:hypothetical protein
LEAVLADVMDVVLLVPVDVLDVLHLADLGVLAVVDTLRKERYYGYVFCMRRSMYWKL